MKLTFWVTGSSTPIEHEVENDDEIGILTWGQWLEDRAESGRFVNFSDGETTAHLIAVDKIDVIKVEA